MHVLYVAVDTQASNEYIEVNTFFNVGCPKYFFLNLYIFCFTDSLFDLLRCYLLRTAVSRTYWEQSVAILFYLSCGSLLLQRDVKLGLAVRSCEVTAFLSGPPPFDYTLCAFLRVTMCQMQ